MWFVDWILDLNFYWLFWNWNSHHSKHFHKILVTSFMHVLREPKPQSVLFRIISINSKILQFKYYATQKELPPDTGLALFTISSRQSSTEFHFQMTFIDSAALPWRNCKQSEPGVTGYFFLGSIVTYNEILRWYCWT